MTTLAGFPDDDENEDEVPTEENFLEDGDILERPSPDMKKFVPTITSPLPCFPCTAIKPDGTRCSRSAIMGMKPDNAKCVSHGGRLPAVKDAAAARCDAARMMMFDNVEVAVDTIRALMEPGTTDAVRLKAATETLDRTIGRAPIDIDVSGHVEVNSADEIRAALAKLIENKIEPLIIDGTVEEDEDLLEDHSEDGDDE